MNLLRETVMAIEKAGKTDADIIFIGSEQSGHSCTWNEFCVLADKEYDNGFGASEVADDLIIVFANGEKLVRAEYDGAEWWDHISPFKMPEKKKPICKLIDTGLSCTLAEMNADAL